MEEANLLPHITAAVTRFDGMDYRSIASVPDDDQRALRWVEEGAAIPQTQVKTQENLVKLHKRGRMLVASYEAIRYQKLDLFSVTLRQIGAHINRMHLEDAIEVLLNGDGNDNPPRPSPWELIPSAAPAGSLTYNELVDFWGQFDPYEMNTPGSRRRDAEDAQAGRVPEPTDRTQFPGDRQAGHAPWAPSCCAHCRPEQRNASSAWTSTTRWRWCRAPTCWWRMTS